MRSILPSLLCLMVSALPANCRPLDELTRNPDVMMIFAELLSAGRNGLRVTENAAFIVRDQTGRYRAVAWPATGETMKQTYRGAIPANTIAVAHTHPKSSRQPSRGDELTAAVLGLPVFVLTPLDIWVATPDGARRAMIRSAFWSADVGRQSRGEILMQKTAMNHELGRTLPPDEVELEAAAEAPGSAEESIVPEPAGSARIAPGVGLAEYGPPPDRDGEVA